MNLQIKPRSERLLKNLREYTQHYEKFAEVAGREKIAFDLYSFIRGINTRQKSFNVYVPATEKIDTYRRDVITQLIENILPANSMELLRISRGVFVILFAEEIVGLFHTSSSAGTHFEVIVSGPNVLLDRIEELLAEHFPATKPPAVNRLGLTHQGNIVTHQELLQVRRPLTNPELFYPGVGETPEELWAGFSASSSNVMLLLGEPGTGKSSFIMELLRARGWDDNVYLVDQDSVLDSPKLNDFIRTLPRGSVIITEDADRLVGKRQEGNKSMTGLLNTTAGLVGTDTKVIVTTNLPTLRDVDEALLRPGRAFRVLHFKPLTTAQGYQLREYLGLPPVVFNSSLKAVTLAEAINYEEQVETTLKASGIGFTTR
jgi:hypothetical protein